MERSQTDRAARTAAGQRTGRGPRTRQTTHVEIGADGFIVDVGLLAELFDLGEGDVRWAMREGKLTSRCEKGVEEHSDRFRLVFFHGTRRVLITLDAAGHILGRSVIDYGTHPASGPASGPAGSGPRTTRGA